MSWTRCYYNIKEDNNLSDNKKYYYLKLKENFFDSEEIKVLESMDNGYKYSNILLKLYLKSLKKEGLLMFKKNIPYNAKMIATVTGHNINDIKGALEIFQQLGLVEILSNGAIYMMDIQNFIGTSSTEADRVRAYRNEVEEKKKQLLRDAENVNPEIFLDGKTGNVTNVQQTNDISTPEKELELKLEKELNKSKEREKDKKLSCSDSKSQNDKVKFDKGSKPYKMAMYLKKKIKSNIPNQPVPKDSPKQMESWSLAMDRLHRLGTVGGDSGYSWDKIKEIIDWCQQDEFWYKNILSASKLRKQAVKLETRMKEDKGYTLNQPEEEIDYYADLREE